MSEGRGLGERLGEQIAGAPPVAPIVDPCAWIERRFRVTLWSGQREFIEAVHEHPFVACRAAHSVGKSKGAALLAAYWVQAHPVGSAFVFTTAPSNAQIRGILWKEFGRAHRDGDLPGRINMGQNPEWWIGDELVGTGRKPADLTDPEEAATAMQGIHSENLLVILDEAAGLAGWVWDAIDSLASNAGARVLALGNPTVRNSQFFEVSQPGSGWHRIKISAFDSPNLTGEQVPDVVSRNLVSAEWVEERRRKWGTGHPMYRSRVEAEFPDADETGLVEPAWIETAHERVLPSEGPVRFGVDVARGGSDQTVVVEGRRPLEDIAKVVPVDRRPLKLRIRHRVNGHDTMQTAGTVGRLLATATTVEGARANIDAIGLGVGVYDRCREQGQAVSAYMSSERAARPTKFKNRRAESFWALREMLREGRVDLDGDEDLAAQLLAIRWSLDSTGRIVIEAKEAMKARGLPSPDLADAAVMALDEASVSTVPVVFIPAPGRSLLDADYGIADARLAYTGTGWDVDW
jgi:hypothetical protein